MMRPQSRVPSQPDLSPTYSPSSPSRIAGEPTRRNIFSAHLSRRPASSQTSQTDSQPQPLPLPSQHRNISPFASPPRLTPTTEYPPPSFSTYDPSQSPNRPLSPRSSATLFPSNSIIAINPSTGRPMIPDIPTLPAHLTFDEEEEEEDAEAEGDANPEEPDQDPNYQYHHQPQHAAHYPPPPSQPHPDPYADPVQEHVDHFRRQYHPQQQQHQSQQQHHPYGHPPPQSPNSMETALITDLMSRYRARQQSQSQPHLHRPPKPRGRNGEEDEDPESAEERAELMAHLMGRLRRVVQSADGDGWMFGEVDLGGGGGGGGEAAGGGVGVAAGGAGNAGGGLGGN